MKRKLIAERIFLLQILCSMVTNVENIPIEIFDCTDHIFSIFTGSSVFMIEALSALLLARLTGSDPKVQFDQSEQLLDTMATALAGIPQMLGIVNGDLLDGFTQLLEYCLTQDSGSKLHYQVVESGLWNSVWCAVGLALNSGPEESIVLRDLEAMLEEVDNRVGVVQWGVTSPNGIE